MFSQDLDSARADPMEVKQHALAASFEVTESAEARGLEGSNGGPTQAVGRGVDDLGMPEIICNQLLNLQGQEPSDSAALH